MSLTPGTRLGPYEIVAALGAGGMGEVYSAVDPALNRRIAIKILPEAVAADPERRDRFEREARAVAALNHPNIVTIHSIEQDAGLRFLTMELVEGKTLGAIIPKGGVTLERFLQTAIQLADAVSAAHERGITHRDLKPPNVMIGADGRVKVLDFGLAKLRADAGVDAAATIAAPPQVTTGDGRILGTVAYMSPEQAEGKPVDHRADIFSLGVIFYELATGQRPFTGDTNVSVIASIVKDAAKPVTDVNPALPRDLAKIVRRCLTKDLDRRYQSAKDLRNDLELLWEEVVSSEAAATVPDRSSHRIWGLIAALVLGAFGVAATMYLFRTNTNSLGGASARVDATFRQLTFQAGMERFPSLSPDGKWFVYAGESSTALDIYLQSVSGENAIDLTRDSSADDTQPSFSPDGERIAFRSERDGGGLFVMGRTGEAVRRLTRNGYTPAWSPDGREIVFSTGDSDLTPYTAGGVGDLWVVELATGATRRLDITGNTEGARQPSWSPHGNRIAFRASRTIRTVPREGGPSTLLTAPNANEWLPNWSPDGRYVYCSSDRDGRLNLWRIPVDERSGQRVGSPQRISAPATQATYLSVAGDGHHIAYSSFKLESNLQRIPLDGETLTVRPGAQWLTQSSRYWESMDVSADGRSLVLVPGVTTPVYDLFVAEADGSGLRQLTNNGTFRSAQWLPDGQTLMFTNRATFQLWSIAADGSGLTKRTDSMTQGFVLSADGRRALSHRHQGSDTSLFIVDLSKTPAVAAAIDTVKLEGGFEPNSWSPDGSRVAAHVQAQPGGVIVFVLSSKALIRVTDAGEFPRWLADGRRLVYMNGPRLLVVDTATKAAREVLSVAPDYLSDFRLSPDGRWLYLLRGAREADVWMATLKN